MTAGTIPEGAPQELDRTLRPSSQPLPRIVLPAIQKSELRNGLSVWLVEQHKLPLVAFSLVIQSGADQDPEEKTGTATMTAEMLEAGTATRDILAIAQELEFLGASMSFRAGTDASQGSLSILTKHLDRGLALFADVLTHPVFPVDEFERMRKQRITALMQQKDRAAAIATIAFLKVLYGTGHPYGNDASGTETSLTGLTRHDITSFHASHYRPNNATLIVVGDVTMAILLPKLEGVFAGWEPEAVKLRVPPLVKGPAKRRVYLIDKPTAPQSEIRVGYPSLARSTPDFFPVTVMNRILGGQFSSRINLNLREKRGYTYGARSTFMFLKQQGPFIVSGGFVSDKTDDSVDQIIGEITRMHNEGLTEEELSFSKKGLTGAFALSFETPQQIAGALQNIVLYGLPDDYYERYLDNIDRVSVDDVRRVSKAYLDAGMMTILVVGDLAAIKAGIEQLGMGEISVLDYEGNPLPA